MATPRRCSVCRAAGHDARSHATNPPRKKAPPSHDLFGERGHKADLFGGKVYEGLPKAKRKGAERKAKGRPGQLGLELGSTPRLTNPTARAVRYLGDKLDYLQGQGKGDTKEFERTAARYRRLLESGYAETGHETRPAFFMRGKAGPIPFERHLRAAGAYEPGRRAPMWKRLGFRDEIEYWNAEHEATPAAIRAIKRRTDKAAKLDKRVLDYAARQRKAREKREARKRGELPPAAPRGTKYQRDKAAANARLREAKAAAKRRRKVA